MTVPSGGYRVTVDELNAVIQHVDTTRRNDTGEGGSGW
jgi:hypothetical protein